MKLREIEKVLYRNVFARIPVVSSSDTERFPMLEEDQRLAMESTFFSDTSQVYVFPFVRKTSQSRGYVDVYIYDPLFYPDVCKRFIIADGWRLPPAFEEYYLSCVHQDFVCSYGWQEIDSMYKELGDMFPDWHFDGYDASQLPMALEHIYYASHRSGAREILYKAGLNYIAFELERIPSCNLIGSTPEKIIGLPLKLLHILNNSSLVSELFSRESIEFCRGLYRKYSDYIGESMPTLWQWEYLKRLYSSGAFGGHPFSRQLYRCLEDPEAGIFLWDYERFLFLRDELGAVMPKVLKRKVPEGPEILLELEELQTFKKYMGTGNEGTAAGDIAAKIYRRKSISGYEYTGKYMVLMPSSGYDLVRESIELENCVWNYIEDHAEGRTTILLLRRNCAPSQPYVTMEVRERRIVQAFAKYNVLPETDVFAFLDDYAKAHDLAYDPFSLIAEYLDDPVHAPHYKELVEYAWAHRIAGS